MEFVEPEAEGPAEESGDEAVTDDETDLGTDWETVPSPRFCDIPSQVNTPEHRAAREGRSGGRGRLRGGVTVTSIAQTSVQRSYGAPPRDL